jgi:hypothetical protein
MEATEPSALDARDAGIVPRACQELFAAAAERRPLGIETTVEVSPLRTRVDCSHRSLAHAHTHTHTHTLRLCLSHVGVPVQVSFVEVFGHEVNDLLRERAGVGRSRVAGQRYVLDGTSANPNPNPNPYPTPNQVRAGRHLRRGGAGHAAAARAAPPRPPAEAPGVRAKFGERNYSDLASSPGSQPVSIYLCHRLGRTRIPRAALRHYGAGANQVKSSA